MKADYWSPKRRIEENYSRELRRLFEGFERIISRLELMSPYGVMERLRAYCGTEFFKNFALASASRMVTGLKVDQAVSWRAAAKESMGGRMIYHALRNELKGSIGITMTRIIRENAQIITTFPERISKEVNDYIAAESLKGRRSEDIAQELVKQFPQVAQARISLIARTETSKASTALTRARADEIGLPWYQWCTSEDARVRPSHRKMDGVLVNWNDPPSPEALGHEKYTYGHYHAGDTFNCRCYPAPVVSMGLIKWPAKVYWQGQIVKNVRRATFMEEFMESKSAFKKGLRGA